MGDEVHQRLIHHPRLRSLWGIIWLSYTSFGRRHVDCIHANWWRLPTYAGRVRLSSAPPYRERAR